MNRIELNKEDIVRLCKRHNVSKLYAFGSVLTTDFHEKSDIDLIVDFKNVKLEDYFDNYYELKFSLEKTFNRSVDLLEERAIKNPYFLQSINKNKKLIYG